MSEPHHPLSDERISAYLDEELSTEERVQFEQELARDESARQALQQLRTLREALGGLPRHQVDERFTERVLQRLGLEPSAAGTVAPIAPLGDRPDDDSSAPTTCQRMADDRVAPGPALRSRALRRGLIWAALTVATAILIMIYQPPDAGQRHGIARAPAPERKRETADFGREAREPGAGAMPAIQEADEGRVDGPTSERADEVARREIDAVETAPPPAEVPLRSRADDASPAPTRARFAAPRPGQLAVPATETQANVPLEAVAQPAGPPVSKVVEATVNQDQLAQITTQLSADRLPVVDRQNFFWERRAATVADAELSELDTTGPQQGRAVSPGDAYGARPQLVSLLVTGSSDDVVTTLQKTEAAAVRVSDPDDWFASGSAGALTANGQLRPLWRENQQLQLYTESLGVRPKAAGEALAEESLDAAAPRAARKSAAELGDAIQQQRASRPIAPESRDRAVELRQETLAKSPSATTGRVLVLLQVVGKPVPAASAPAPDGPAAAEPRTAPPSEPK